jgi:polygalacturonase
MTIEYRPQTWWRLSASFSATALLASCLLPVAGHAQSSAQASCSEPAKTATVINVKDKGAKGNGRTDDTAAIQEAIDAASQTRGTVFVPDGVYMVEVVTQKRLALKSNMTFAMSGRAVLRAIPTNSVQYRVLTISGATNVVVTGGTLEGDRDKHKGKTGEWGMGLFIGDGARAITVNRLQANKMWGDGFYISGANNLTLCEISADSNRRQGLSIIDATGVVVMNSVFKNTNGTRPGAGIDLEPNGPNQKIIGVQIRNSKFIGNEGGGVLIAGKKGRITNIEVSHNTFTGNKPIDIEHAPKVLDAKICNNRHILAPDPTLIAGPMGMQDPASTVVLQEMCGDRRLMTR